MNFTTVKPVIVLSLICALSGFILSSLRTLTAPRIEMQVLANVQSPAIAYVFGETENDPVAERKTFELEGGKKVMVFPAKRGGKLYGVAMEEFSPGYGGAVGIMVGIDIDTSRLIGIGVTTMSETPGLGSLIAMPKFSGQFRGSEFGVALTSRGGKIDAVAGATISSNAAVESVRKAVAVYEKIKPDLALAWN